MTYFYRVGRAVSSRTLGSAALLLMLAGASACGGDDSDNDVAGDASHDASDARGDASRVDAADASRVDARGPDATTRVDASDSAPVETVEAAPDASARDVSTQDVVAESTVATDGRADVADVQVSIADARPDVVDARADVADARPDSTSDGAVDAQVDAADAATVSGPPLATFIQELDRVWCERLNSCCGGQTSRASCRTFLDENFGALSVGKYLQAYGGDFTGAHFSYNPVEAQRCIDQVNAFACGVTPATVVRDAYNTCMGAVQPLLVAGQTGCRTSAECVSGYCALGQDGGPSTCVALGRAGDPCDDPNYNGDRCSALGINTTQNTLFCQPPGPVRPGTAPVCVSRLAESDSCLVNQQCASGLCAGGNCRSSGDVFASFCAYFPGDGG